LWEGILRSFSHFQLISLLLFNSLWTYGFPFYLVCYYLIIIVWYSYCPTFRWWEFFQLVPFWHVSIIIWVVPFWSQKVQYILCFAGPALGFWPTCWAPVSSDSS
jgi:hypothetical protein